MARKRTNLIGNTPSVRETKVAIYIRVSTIHQVDKDSIPMQKKDLIAYCQLILGTDNYEIFEDAGYSGKNTDRPAFQNMMGRIRKGEFTHVLVWKIDRVSRNLLDFAEVYEELTVANGTVDAFLLDIVMILKKKSFPYVKTKPPFAVN